jgi:hypothetical protein
MTKAKGRPQRERGLPEISGAPEADEASPDAEEEAEEYGTLEDYPIYLTEDDRAHVRTVRGLRKQLLDFALVQQVKVDGKWCDVVRYDCAHDEVHVDTYRKGRKKPTKKKVCGLDEIEDGYNRAEAAIFDRWQENRRRYFNG